MEMNTTKEGPFHLPEDLLLQKIVDPSDRRPVALRYSENYKITSRAEASLVLNLTEYLNNQLRSYYVKNKGIGIITGNKAIDPKLPDIKSAPIKTQYNADTAPVTPKSSSDVPKISRCLKSTSYKSRSPDKKSYESRHDVKNKYESRHPERKSYKSRYAERSYYKSSSRKRSRERDKKDTGYETREKRHRREADNSKHKPSVSSSSAVNESSHLKRAYGTKSSIRSSSSSSSSSCSSSTVTSSSSSSSTLTSEKKKIINRKESTSLNAKKSPSPKTRSSLASSDKQATQKPSSLDTQGMSSGSLTPEILNVLKGKDVDTVTEILKSIAFYYPSLQGVNLAEIAQLLYRTGALD